MSNTDSKADKNWKKSNVALDNYNNYINGKIELEKKFDLTLIDLLYISNFKGGNATINEEENFINAKLKAYSNVFINIHETFGNKNLSTLKESEVHNLLRLIVEVIDLSKKRETGIDGFKSSYLSALLHSYFPNLIPILDRRLLINLGLVEKIEQLNNQKQVKHIEDYYPDLIKTVQKKSIELEKSVRELDEIYFKQELPNWVNRKIKKEDFDTN